MEPQEFTIQVVITGLDLAQVGDIFLALLQQVEDAGGECGGGYWELKPEDTENEGLTEPED